MKVTFGVYILIALNLALDATEMSASGVFSFSEETYLKTSGNLTSLYGQFHYLFFVIAVVETLCINKLFLNGWSWSYLLEGDEGCVGRMGKLLC